MFLLLLDCTKIATALLVPPVWAGEAELLPVHARGHEGEQDGRRAYQGHYRYAVSVG